MDTKLLKEVNDLLASELGPSPFGVPNFRIAWSTGLTEKRFGTFSDFYGKIFLRQVTEVRDVLKYPFDQDRWILERAQSAAGNRELMGDYSYEPLYVFKDEHGLYLPLERRPVEVLIHRIKNPLSPSQIREVLEKRLESQEEDEVNAFLNVLHDVGRSPLFAYEDSVFLDSTKRKVD
jgi:hypothetical protein